MLRQLSVVFLLFSLGIACGFVIEGVGAEAKPQLENDSTAYISELYPNPVAPYTPGEFVTIRFPPEANRSAYTLEDAHRSVSISPQERYLDGAETTELDPLNTTYTTLPNEQDGWTELTYSTDANRTAWLTEREVAQFQGYFSLANDGDHLRLKKNGTVVDEYEYTSAPEGETYDIDTGEWSPLGATEKPVTTSEGGTVKTFVLPDDPDRTVEFLDGATEQLILAGYTLSDEDVVETLIDAHEAGIEVSVLVEGSPVGGMVADEAAALDTLDRAGVTVRVLDGEKARYRYHHPKYAIVDDRALVTTENWKPAGTGGQSSRGWAAITNQTDIVDGLRSTYEADIGWVDTLPWDEHDPTLVEPDGSSGGPYPAAISEQTLTVEQTDLVLAPDNAEAYLLEQLNAAEERIDIKQVQITDRSFPLLEGAIAAAERGVDVRILLSSQWYAQEDNEQLKEKLTEHAKHDDLPVDIRLAQPGDAFEKIHAKGVVIDGEQAFVGSINWNNNSLRNNREVGLMLHGEEVGEYYQTVFETDWERRGDDGAGEDIPLGMITAVAMSTLLALAVARRLEFDTEQAEQ